MHVQISVVNGLGIFKKVDDGEIASFEQLCAARDHDLKVNRDVIGQRPRVAFGVHEEMAIIIVHLEILALESPSLGS